MANSPFIRDVPAAQAIEAWRAAREAAGCPERLPAIDVPITEAAGLVTAAPVWATRSSPPFDAAGMDGIAVRAADTYGVSEGLPGYLTVTGAVLMGAEPAATVKPGTAVAMPTGGALPSGADAVVMIEYTAEAMPGTIEVVRPVAPGEGVVRADEDARVGQQIIPNGRVLRPQDLGMLAAAGVTSVRVHARPVVTIFSTGAGPINSSSRAGSAAASISRACPVVLSRSR